MSCCGGGKKKIVPAKETVRSSTVPEETVELIWTGVNVGPIPIKSPSGRVYRVSTIRKCVPARPEDVDFLLSYSGMGSFRRADGLAQPDDGLDMSHLSEPTITKTPVFAEEAKAVAIEPVDISTIAALETALDGPVTLEMLTLALENEQANDKPRKGIVERLENAIDDFGDPGNV